jgi:hypothetical protein
MTDALMAREMITERGIMAAFIGHHRGFFRNIGLDDRDDIGRAGAIDMERAVILVAVPRRLIVPSLRPMKVSSASTIPPGRPKV